MTKDRPTAEDRIVEIIAEHLIGALPIHKGPFISNAEARRVGHLDNQKRFDLAEEIATAIQQESGAQERYDKVIKMFNDRKSERPHPAVVRRWIELASGLPPKPTEI